MNKIFDKRRNRAVDNNKLSNNYLVISKYLYIYILKMYLKFILGEYSGTFVQG